MTNKKISLICQECGKSFIRYIVKDRPQLFCSRMCYLKSDHHRAIQSRKMSARGLVLDKNPSWKGENVSYKGLHKWISLNLGCAKDFVCKYCNGSSGSKTMNWSNLDHKYARDVKMWVPLCKKCHSRYDQDHFQCYSKKS